MRKVKLLALLLAALMVVAAFAGCADTTAIESDVANLEDRVDALEGKVDSAVSGIDEVKDALEADKTAEELKKIQDANNALLEQIKQLQEDLKKAEDKIDEKPATPEAPVIDTAALQKLADEYGAKIGRLQAEVMADQKEYFPADYLAILESLTAAQTEIAAAGTVDAMKVVFANLEKKLAGINKITDNFYAYYVALKGNYVGDEACLALVAEAGEYYEAAEKHFADLEKDKWFENYETGDLDKKGNAVKVDLDDCLNDMNKTWPEALEKIKADAKDIVKSIKNIKPEQTYSQLVDIATEYAAWKKAAVALAPVHANLVTNYADLVAAQAASLNFTVAESIVKELSIAPMFGEDTDVDLFAYYDILVAEGTQNIFVVVDKNGVFALNDDEVVYTSDIYEAIEASIAAWAEENDITADVAEYLINKHFSPEKDPASKYYATFKNVAAFVASMEKEFETFKAIANDIKALNTKKLSASQELFTAYNNNADAINNWYDASVKAYKAACDAADKADKKAADTRAVAKGDYAAVLTANFNEMVVLAGLGTLTKVGNEKVYLFGDTENYTLGFVADDDTTNDNYNYIQFYSFDDEFTAEFLKTTFVDAETIADAINEKVAKFNVLTQTSVETFLINIGGYYKYNNDLTKLVENKNADVNTVAGFLATYGKNGSAYENYNAKNKPDLSALVDVAAYNKVVTDLFARIDAIDAATAALNKAYADLLGTYDEVVLTTANTGAVANLVKAITDWKKVGGRDDVIIATKVANKDEYTLVNVIDAYESLAANKKDGKFTFEATIAKLEERATLIAREAQILVSLYRMLDAANGFSTITFDSLVKTNNLKGAYAVTKIEKSAANKDGDTDWNITYVTYKSSDHKFTTTTAYHVGDEYNNQSESDALKDSKHIAAVSGKLYAPKADDNGVKDTLTALEAKWNGKSFTVAQLIEIASDLYAKFMVDNYGVKDETVEKARATFAAEAGGYEYIGWHRDIYDDFSAVGYSTTALKDAKNLTAITLVLNAAEGDPNLTEAAKAIFANDIVRGGAYLGSEMTSDFKLSDEAIDYLDIDLSDYDVKATTIWEAPERQ